MAGPAYSNELNIISDEILKVLDSWIRDYANYPLYQKTVQEINSNYNSALTNGERVFAISHSQGGLFMRDAFARLTTSNKKKFFSGFQVASPLNGFMDSHFGYATHDKDRLINALRTVFGALPSNVTAPFFVSNGHEGIGDYVLDFIINHGMVTTYLHDPTIREQVITNLISTAQLLESNCEVTVKYHRENSDVKFIASGLNISENSGVIYRWDFGDNQLGKVSKNVIIHSYNTPGIYDVVLTVIFPNGEKITSKLKIRIPDLKINYTTDKLKASIFANEPEAIGQTYTWYFGDNSAPEITTTKTVTHDYKEAGDYTVFLSIEDAKGNITEAERLVSVRGSNEITIRSSFIDSANELQLFVSGSASRNSLDEALVYAWDFGDGTVEVGTNPITVHNYQYAGFYIVSLLVKDPSGRTASSMKEIFIPGSYPHITYKMFGRNVEFTIHDDFKNSEASYAWNFGDGDEKAETTTSKTITHSYDDILKKDFSVKIVMRNVVIYQLADILPDRTPSLLSYRIMNRNVEFYLNTVLSSENVSLSYKWDFGDGQTAVSNTPTVVHPYYNEGTYAVTVGVYDEIGRLLFNQQVFVLADQVNGGVIANMPVILSDGSSGVDLILQGLNPTNKAGFIYEKTNPVYGTCYVKSFDYFYIGTVEYVSVPFYNCTVYDDYFQNYPLSINK